MLINTNVKTVKAIFVNRNNIGAIKPQDTIFTYTTHFLGFSLVIKSIVTFHNCSNLDKMINYGETIKDIELIDMILTLG